MHLTHLKKLKKKLKDDGTASTELKLLFDIRKRDLKMLTIKTQKMRREKKNRHRGQTNNNIQYFSQPNSSD